MTETKICKLCDREFSRPRRKDGYLVDERKWRQQELCSRDCSRKLGGAMSHGAARADARHGRGWNGGKSIWTKAELAKFDQLNRAGMTWAEMWRLLSPDRGSNDSLRLAVKAWRTGGKPKSLRGRTAPPDRSGLKHHEAAALLSRPTPRQAALLACEPESARRLMGWT